MHIESYVFAQGLNTVHRAERHCSENLMCLFKALIQSIEQRGNALRILCVCSRLEYSP